MKAPASVSERDLRILAGIVSDDRPDLPADEGLPPSLLAELMGQICCDEISFDGYAAGDRNRGSGRPSRGGSGFALDWSAVFCQQYRDCQPCSYPDRTGDLRSIVKVADFYSARQWHSTSMYCDNYRPRAWEHHLMVTLFVPRIPSTALTSRVARRRPAVMITGHVPAVRLPPDHADDHMAAAVPA